MGCPEQIFMREVGRLDVSKNLVIGSDFLLVLERTVQCLRIVRFFVMFDMFEVRFWAKM